MELVDVLGDHGLEQTATLELGQRPVCAVRLLVAEDLKPRAIEAPELGRIAPECVDVSHLHGIDLLPQPLPRTSEIRNPRRDGDPRAGEGDGALRLSDQLREPRRLVCDYLPCHFGERFPRKAEMPSLASSEKKAAANPCFSASIPASRSPLLETRLICSTATGACSASLRAHEIATSSSSSSGTRSSARPWNLASGPRIASPVR